MSSNPGVIAFLVWAIVVAIFYIYHHLDDKTDKPFVQYIEDNWLLFLATYLIALLIVVSILNQGLTTVF